jgi:hypothetical protein
MGVKFQQMPSLKNLGILAVKLFNGPHKAVLKGQCHAMVFEIAVLKLGFIE